MRRSTPHGPEIKGQLFAARLLYIRENHGPGVIEKVLEAMTDEDRKRLRGLERAAWYPFGLLNRLDRAIGRTLYPGDPRIFERLGEASAMKRAEWLGDHAPLVSVHGFLSRVADEHHRYHNFGHGSYRRKGFSEGEIVFSGYPELDEVYCAGARGYFRGAVQLLTGGAVSVEERQCQCRGDACCLFRVRWAARGLAAQAVSPARTRRSRSRIRRGS